MYELVQVGPRSYYINAPVKIGVYLAEENQVYLIDSGNDKDAGRKLRQLLEKQGWTLRAILNTHSNADHIGGNQYLWKQTGCKIYAPGGLCLYPSSFAGALLPLRWVSSQGLAAQVFDGQGESCRVSYRCRAAQRVDLLSPSWPFLRHGWFSQ